VQIFDDSFQVRSAGGGKGGGGGGVVVVVVYQSEHALLSITAHLPH